MLKKQREHVNDLAIAAALTTGTALPESKSIIKPMCVIFQTAEGGLGDTVKLRLVQSGADCRRVIVIDESEKELSLGGNVGCGVAILSESASKRP